jgi:hypothetical protein
MSLSNSIPLSILQPGVCTSSTRPTNPYTGQTIYETDTDKVLVYDGGWIPPKNVAQGAVAYAQVTANQGSITTITDVTGLSVTWTAEAARRYKVTAHSMILSSVNDDICQLWITDSSNVAKTWAAVASRNTGFGVTLVATYLINGISGSQTYKVRAQRQSGTGTITTVAAATAPAYILVEDIGGLV